MIAGGGGVVAVDAADGIERHRRQTRKIRQRGAGRQLLKTAQLARNMAGYDDVSMKLEVA